MVTMARIPIIALLLLAGSASAQDAAETEPTEDQPEEVEPTEPVEGGAAALGADDEAVVVDPPPLSEEERRTAEARSLFRRGVDLIRQERWGEALEYFEESRAIVERPSTIMNIAACLQRLGRVVETARALEDYLRIAPEDDPRRPAAEQMKAEATGRIAHLVLSLSPASVTVLVDEEPASGEGTERELLLDPGRHVVRVSAEGYEPDRITVTVIAGASESAEIHLEPIPEVEPETLIVEAPRKPLTPYLVLAGSGLAALVGATLALVSIRDYERVENPPAGSSWADIEGDFDRGVRRRRTGVILSGVGLAGVAVGLGLVLSGGSDEDEPGVEPTVGFGRLGLRGRF